jgi:uncharacterized membrane protein
VDSYSYFYFSICLDFLAIIIVSGFFMGFVLTLTSYLFLLCLFTFFITSSKVTKFRSVQKRKTEEGFKEGKYSFNNYNISSY